MREYFSPDSDFVDRLARFLDEGEAMENGENLAELRVVVRSIHSEVKDVKAAARDAVNGLLVVRDKIDAGATEQANRFETAIATTHVRVESVRTELNGRIDKLIDSADAQRQELSVATNGVRAELVTQVVALRVEMGDSRKEMVSGFQVVRTEVDAMRKEFTGEFRGIRGEMHEMRKEIVVEVQGVRSEMQAMRQDVDARFQAAHAQMEVVRGDVAAEFRSVRAEMHDVRREVGAEIQAVRADFTRRADELQRDFGGKCDSIKDAVSSAKLWALGLYVALAASLLLVMARGFKWI